MEITVLFFGPLIDIIGCSSNLFQVESSNELKALIDRAYPSSKGIKYTIAVNQKIVNENTFFVEGDEVALLPPFAGG